MKTKTTEAKNELTINQIIGLNTCIAHCKNDRDLKLSATTLSGIRLKRQSDKIIKEYFEQQEEIFKKFDVKKIVKGEREGYDYSKHPDAEKIKAAVKELEQTKFTLDGLNAIDEEDFVIFTRGLAQGDVAFLYEYLVVVDSEA